MPLIGQEIPGEWAEDCEKTDKTEVFVKRTRLGITRTFEQAHILTLRNCG